MIATKMKRVIVQAALEQAVRGRTIVAITQRSSTMQNADPSFVLEDGRIVERGTYEELPLREDDITFSH